MSYIIEQQHAGSNNWQQIDYMDMSDAFTAACRVEELSRDGSGYYGILRARVAHDSNTLVASFNCGHAPMDLVGNGTNLQIFPRTEAATEHAEDLQRIASQISNAVIALQQTVENSFGSHAIMMENAITELTNIASVSTTPMPSVGQIGTASYNGPTAPLPDEPAALDSGRRYSLPIEPEPAPAGIQTENRAPRNVNIRPEAVAIFPSAPEVHVSVSLDAESADPRFNDDVRTLPGEESAIFPPVPGIEPEPGPGDPNYVPF